MVCIFSKITCSDYMSILIDRLIKFFQSRCGLIISMFCSLWDMFDCNTNVFFCGSVAECPPPMSGLSLLSYPSRRLFRMCVTSLSYTLGVSTHVLFDTSSSSSFWRELHTGKRTKTISALKKIFHLYTRLYQFKETRRAL